MRKIFTILCAALMSVGMFATTVTWDSNTLSSIYIYDDESFTQDGVTVTSLNGVIDGDWQGGSSDASFKFSTSLGNFTKIEITGTIYMLGGSGWTLTSPGAVWTGEANETTFGQNFDNVSQIVFTIGEPEPAGEVTIVFAANNKTVERTVTLPHTFKCSWDNGMDGPDELDIIIHELYNDYYYCNSNMNASGSDQVEVGTEEAPKNDYITIKGVFEGTATVTGDYFDWITGDEGEHNYSITISIKGDEPAPEPLFEISYEDKWLNIAPDDAEAPYFLWLDSKLFYDGKYTEYTQEKMGGYMDYIVGVVNGANMTDLFLLSGEQKIAPNALLTSQETSPYSLNDECIAFVFKYDATDKKRVSDVEYFVFTYAGEPEQEEGLENVQRDNVPCTKVMENGVLYLMYKGTKYNVQGAMVK